MRNIMRTLFLSLLVALIIVLALPTVAQDNAGKFEGFSSDQMIYANLDCVMSAKTDGRPANQTDWTGLTVTIGSAEFECADVMTYVQTTWIGKPIVDYSWLLDVPTFNALGGDAMVRVAADANAKPLGSIQPAGTPVVEVDAILKISETETRLLIRTPQITGWVNNSNAKVNTDATVEKPAGWQLAVDPDSLNNDGGGEPHDWSYPTLYAPNGDPVTDVYRTGTDLLGHGRLIQNSDAHFVYAVREDGKYNPAVVYNGFYQRVEGDLWRYFAGWNTGGDVTGPGKCSIACEFMIKDANEHKLVQFAPSVYVFLGMNGQVKFFQQDNIFTWPAVADVLNNAVCPSQPVWLNVAGENSGSVSEYNAAVGNHACPSFLIGLMPDTPAGTVEVMSLEPGTQAQNVSYIRSSTAFYMGSEKMTASEWTAWLSANLSSILDGLSLTGITSVRVTGFPGMTDATVDMGAIVAGPS